AHWAGAFSRRHLSAAQTAEDSQVPAPRLILFASTATNQSQLVDWLKRTGYVRRLERAGHFIVAVFSRHIPTVRLRAILDSPQIGYAEPDCDGPDFLTTSREESDGAVKTVNCWQRSA